MRSEYERIVRLVCGDDWCMQSKSPDEKDGGFGVAITLAFVKGTSPRLSDLSRELDVPHYILEMAYRRLQVNGLLSSRSWTLKDPYLTGRTVSSGEDQRRAMLNWCHVAAMSSGFLGRGLTRAEMPKHSKER